MKAGCQVLLSWPEHQLAQGRGGGGGAGAKREWGKGTMTRMFKSLSLDTEQEALLKQEGN